MMLQFVFALGESMQEGALNLMLIAVIGVAIICALMFADSFIGIIGMLLIVSSGHASAFRTGVS